MVKRFIVPIALAMISVGLGCAQDTATQEKAAVDQEDEVAVWTGPRDDTEEVAPGEVDEDAPTVFKTTESGLQYRILRKGDAENKPAKTDEVTVHYKGWLDNTKIFDSSYQRGEKISFPLNRVVAGWTEGLQLVGKGGMIELIIPSELGYGERGSPGAIPPNATLHFLVELYEIE